MAGSRRARRAPCRNPQEVREIRSHRFLLIGFRSTAPLIFIALWTAAVVAGIVAVRGLTWPYDVDGLRDIAIAQAIRDGRSPLADPLYQGHAAWYSPLVPAIVALVAAVTGGNVPVTHVQAGAWLNALAPIAFFFCARVLVGVWPALAATCAFLFLPGRPPAWASATYSPWLFPALFAQALLYAGLAFWTTTLDRAKPYRLVLSGLILALTFLAHSGAAALLGGIMMITAWSAGGFRPTPVRRLTALVVPPLVAIAVSLPFLLPLALQYGLRVVNRVPGTWIHEATQPEAIVAGLSRPGAWLHLALVALGLWWIANRVRATPKIVLTAWPVVAAFLYGYSVLAQRFEWPAIVPAYHFYFMLRGWKWVVFGCGLIAVVDVVVRRWNARGRHPIPAEAAYAGIVILLAAGVYPRYLGREAFKNARTLSQQLAVDEERGLHGWMREHTDPTSVFLASDNDALTLVGPAGRSVVCVASSFSNPYVDHMVRATARDRMFHALVDGDGEAFDRLRREFGVTHVLARDRQVDSLRLHPELVREAFSAGSVTVFEVR